ncbi:3-oxo-5-alpha-steroid 4-dehydrogenase 1-like [Cucurbita pepo subsp. pepo]|uniref:3-oxo-5-alpha-steroid 4-dehydrogenase 1-like n=1 Tax=Cucurbita pepo subsp. pepo TaxID=3664 RepID=UPI000C9D94A0|nr:3-oxo-5-alpha-steroid 4-dehydrogenase 1-like [Cucurbita pepo subsp. pepo]
MPTFLFSPFSSTFLLALSSLTMLSILVLATSEFLGRHLQYSKFWSPKTSSNKIHLPSRSAMLLCYVPAFAVASISLFLLLLPRYNNSSTRIFLINSLLLIHFFKRIFEVLFVHKYSNKMGLSDAIRVSITYVLLTASTISSQMVSHNLEEPQIDLRAAGLAMYWIGITGNLYHHVLLAKLRKEGDREYRIPRGGMFEVIVCPHYLFEMVEFLGIAFVSQTLFPMVFAFGSALFLIGRSYATRNWYVSKFEDFPRHVKAILPFVF